MGATDARRHHRSIMATIALLEDEPSLRYLFQRILELDGHTVRSYADGQTALAGLIAAPPALFVTDLHVPRLSGIEVVRAFRADPRGRDVPCILLSGSAEADVIEAAALATFTSWLSKPVDIAVFRDAVAACLEGRTGRRTA